MLFIAIQVANLVQQHWEDMETECVPTNVSNTVAVILMATKQKQSMPVCKTI